MKWPFRRRGLRCLLHPTGDIHRVLKMETCLKDNLRDDDAVWQHVRNHHVPLWRFITNTEGSD